MSQTSRVRVRNLEADRLGGVEQPVDVTFELEDAAVVGADALEDAVAVQQAVVEDADRGFGGRPPARRSRRRGRRRVRRDGLSVRLDWFLIAMVKPSCPRLDPCKRTNR